MALVLDRYVSSSRELSDVMVMMGGLWFRDGGEGKERFRWLVDLVG